MNTHILLYTFKFKKKEKFIYLFDYNKCLIKQNIDVVVVVVV
jgi:hypothetical protein